MKVINTKIEGLFLIDALKFEDLRGELIKPYNFDQYSKLVINLDFKETWFTKSKKNVIRAMHLQINEMACEKLVSVINGSVIDVVLDLRTDSLTYGNYFEIELNDKEPKALYIPKGCAHGYKVLENNTITMYKATKVHSEKHDLGIKWDSFGYDWKIKNPILSDKDKNLIEFKDYL
jgi:dTDP-4-dehydrorhamnose 3,5-epimerase